MNRSLVALLLFAVAGSTLLPAGCGTPGKDVVPEPGDFAFLEVKLKG